VAVISKKKEKEEVSKPILDISLAGNYCLILCEGALQIFTICNYLMI